MFCDADSQSAVAEQVPWDVPARWYEMYPLERVALAPDRSPPLQVPPIAMTSIMADGWADDFADWGQLRANGSVSGSYPYRLRHISIRTGIQNWLRFAYDFENWPA